MLIVSILNDILSLTGSALWWGDPWLLVHKAAPKEPHTHREQRYQQSQCGASHQIPEYGHQQDISDSGWDRCRDVALHRNVKAMAAWENKIPE